MKKILKNAVAVSALSLILCVFMTACQLSQVFGKNTTSVITTGTPETSGTPEPVYEDMHLNLIDLSPYVTMGEYKNITLEIEKAEVTEAEVNAAIAEILSANAAYNQIKDRKTAAGDTLNIDFAGYMDGVAFEGGTASNQEIALTSTSGYIDGFADGLIDKEVGSVVELNLNFPENYTTEPSYSGKAVVFKVTINFINGDTKITPEYNDEFVDKYTNGEYKTTAAFTEYYTGAMIEDEKQTNDTNAKNNLWTIIENNATIIELPEQQVMYYYTSQKNSYKSTADSYGMTYEDILSYYGETDESILTGARNTVKSDLIYYSILKAENITLTDEEYTESLANLAKSYSAKPEDFESYYGKEYMEGYFLWTKTTDFLFESANKVYVDPKPASDNN